MITPLNFFGPLRLLQAACIGALMLLGTSVMANDFSNNVSISNISGSNLVIINGKVISGGGAMQNDGKLVEQVRQINDFNTLKIRIAADISYEQGPAPSIKISGGENALKSLTTEVKDGKLAIDLEGNFSLKHEIKIVITSPSLKSVAFSGSGKFVATNLKGDKLKAKLSGSGKVKLSGESEDVSLSLSGSGGIDASNLRASALDVDLSGSGSIYGYAEDSAEGDLSGSGSIRIAGQPKERSIDKSGSGTVRFD